MNGSSPLLRALRSTTSSAFLAGLLLGCGNASSGAVAQQTVEQDWEVQPNLWAPRAILIPRKVQPRTADTIPDSIRTVTLQSTLHADSSAPDSGRVDTIT